MILRIVPPVLWAALSIWLVLLAALPAKALDMNEAQRDGALIADALDMGSQGDWGSAQQFVAGSDRLLQDIVLWRKLRAGRGSFQEYQDYTSRRGDWPGGEVLERVVLGASGSGGGGSLTGLARENWREFSRLWKKRRYEEAEIFLQPVSQSAG